MFAGDPRSAYLHRFLRVPHRMLLSRSTVATGLAVQLESHVPLVVFADAVPKHHLALHRGPRLAAFLCVITAENYYTCSRVTSEAYISPPWV